MVSSELKAGDARLGKGLQRRHVNLIALGGVIGAGLFVGSGVVIGSAGPAAIVSFLIGGIITVLIMRMLAEMAVARPVVGSFYVYARQALGRRGGFVTGWMYWYFFVIVVAVEAVAGGRIVQLWLPAVPLWALSLGLMLALTATNLVSARSFGEFEYWFSSVKVIAIVVFLAMGALWITGLWPHSTPGLANLIDHGGFAPLGWGAVLAAVVPCVAFYTGAEIVTIAAAESDEPERAVTRAMKSIVFRIIAFYVGSILVVVALQPWNTKSVSISPYASVLTVLGIPGVATIMNVIVLTAVLSCLNSALYSTSRMLFALTTSGDAPRFFTKLSPVGSCAARFCWYRRRLRVGRRDLRVGRRGVQLPDQLLRRRRAVRLPDHRDIPGRPPPPRRADRTGHTETENVAVPVAELRHHHPDGHRHPGDGGPAGHPVPVPDERCHPVGHPGRLRGGPATCRTRRRGRRPAPADDELLVNALDT